MLLYLLSVAVFYSAAIVKTIIILSVTYSGGFFLITALNVRYKAQHSTLTTATKATGIPLHENNHTTSEGGQIDPASHHARNRQKLSNSQSALRVRTNHCDNGLPTYFKEQFDTFSQGLKSTNSTRFSDSNHRHVSAQTPELLHTLYEKKELPATLDFGNTGSINKNKIYRTENENGSDNDTTGGSSPSAKNASISPLPLPTSPIPTTSLSSPSPMIISHAFLLCSQANIIPSSTCGDVFARTPPPDLSPSVSTSTTASHPCVTPTPSCSTASTSSLRQHRRNSRVGWLVQQFEIGRLEKSISTPTIKLDKIYAGSICPKVTDTIATLNKSKTGASKIPRRIDINTTMTVPTSTSVYSPALCHSPKNLIPSTSTRTIDQRSIGFRSAFTTWEKKVSEAKSSAAPSPSMSTPVFSSSSRTRN